MSRLGKTYDAPPDVTGAPHGNDHMRKFSFRSAGFPDIDALVTLEKAVEAALPSRDMFAIDDADFVATPYTADATRLALIQESVPGVTGWIVTNVTSGGTVVEQP